MSFVSLFNMLLLRVIITSKEFPPHEKVAYGGDKTFIMTGESSCEYEQPRPALLEVNCLILHGSDVF